MKPIPDGLLLYKAAIISSFFDKISKLGKGNVIQKITKRLEKDQLTNLGHCMASIGTSRELIKYPEELAIIYEVISETDDKTSLLQISDPYYTNKSGSNDLIDYYYQRDYIYPEFKAAIDDVNRQPPYSDDAEKLNLVRASIQAKEKNRDQLEEEINTSNIHLQHLRQENEKQTLAVAIIENNRKISTLKKQKKISAQAIDTLKAKVLNFNQTIRALKEKRSILKKAALSTKEKADNHIESSNGDYSSSKTRANKLAQKTEQTLKEIQRLIDDVRNKKSMAVNSITLERNKIEGYDFEIKSIQAHLDYLKTIGNITYIPEIQSSEKLDKFVIDTFINEQIQEKVSSKAELSKELFSNSKDREAARKKAGEINSQIASLTKLIQNNVTPLKAIIENTQEALREKTKENDRLYKKIRNSSMNIMVKKNN